MQTKQYMGFSFLGLICLMLKGSTATNPEADVPGLDTIQSRNARSIATAAKTKEVGIPGCKVAMVAALGDSGLKNLANPYVPDSLKYAHDGLSTSKDDRIGIFQQSSSVFKDTATIMDPEKAAELFIVTLKAISGWETLTVDVAAQKVQRSAYPGEYTKHVSPATTICDSLMAV